MTSTYACNLCQLTHGVLGEREAWKEFKKIHPPRERYPVVLRLDDENHLSEVLDGAEIERLSRSEDLIETLRKRSG